VARRFDGGYGGDVGPTIKRLIRNQMQAVGFGGSGVMSSPVGWVGTESGLPGGREIWSIGYAPCCLCGAPVAPGTSGSINKSDMSLYQLRVSQVANHLTGVLTWQLAQEQGPDRQHVATHRMRHNPPDRRHLVLRARCAKTRRLCGPS
jgi:hypothetical protein